MGGGCKGIIINNRRCNKIVKVPGGVETGEKDLELIRTEFNSVCPFLGSHFLFVGKLS